MNSRLIIIDPRAGAYRGGGSKGTGSPLIFAALREAGCGPLQTSVM
jgi:hypothetical protein